MCAMCLSLAIRASFWVRYWLDQHALRRVGGKLPAKWSMSTRNDVRSKRLLFTHLHGRLQFIQCKMVVSRNGGIWARHASTDKWGSKVFFWGSFPKQLRKSACWLTGRSMQSCNWICWAMWYWLGPVRLLPTSFSYWIDCRCNKSFVHCGCRLDATYQSNTTEFDTHIWFVP